MRGLSFFAVVRYVERRRVLRKFRQARVREYQLERHVAVRRLGTFGSSSPLRLLLFGPAGPVFGQFSLSLSLARRAVD